MAASPSVISFAAPRLTVITGTPHAIASTVVIENPS